MIQIYPLAKTGKWLSFPYSVIFFIACSQAELLFSQPALSVHYPAAMCLVQVSEFLRRLKVHKFHCRSCLIPPLQLCIFFIADRGGTSDRRDRASGKIRDRNYERQLQYPGSKRKEPKPVYRLLPPETTLLSDHKICNCKKRSIPAHVHFISIFTAI